MSKRAQRIAALALPFVAAGALLASEPSVAAKAAGAASSAPIAPSSSASMKIEPDVKLGPQVLNNPGFPPAYFYAPKGSKKAMKPVIVYLHGRGSNSQEHCRAWAKVATEFGWLLCPSGQQSRGGGEYAWNNDYINGTKDVMGALFELRKKFGKRVQLKGNVLIGFSEGAYVAQNIGPRNVETFNRWMIVAACDRYWSPAAQMIHDEKKKIKRVFLWTGELDGAAPETEQAYKHLSTEGINVKMSIPKGFWHAIPVETMAQNYRKVLRWLVAAK